MNIITYFNQFLKDNFNNFLKRYFEESNNYTKNNNNKKDFVDLMHSNSLKRKFYGFN